jgi:CTP synthase
LKDEKLDQVICRYLHLDYRAGSLNAWKKKVVNVMLAPQTSVKVAVVGKYIELPDAYKSIYEALIHGGIANQAAVTIKKVDAEKVTKRTAASIFKNVHGILVPGGFGDRGIEGKIRAIEYARENKMPFFGICLGMQCAVIEFARNVANLKGADSTEFNKKTPHPVICLLEEQEKVKDLGGTMRLGAYPCDVKKGSLAHSAYHTDKVYERHRHRYEFNNKYREKLKEAGLRIAGTYSHGKLVEVVELENHPWFVAGQFHPEFKSKPDKAHPLFRNFIRAALLHEKAAAQ